jgi:putative endonuclease
MSKQGFIYILSNKHNTTLYLGVTNDLRRRVAEHKLHINSGFTDKYNIEKLVYFEIHEQLYEAIQREKQLKKWRREWKDALINGHNPEWNDLSETIGLNDEYIQSVKEHYEESDSAEAMSKGTGDCGSSPQ